jgi:hypothetical protein
VLAGTETLAVWRLSDMPYSYCSNNVLSGSGSGLNKKAKSGTKLLEIIIRKKLSTP